jgi:hypothetical protein
MAPGLRRSRLTALAAGELAQGHLRAELDRAPAGDVRLISLCAGQGRDVIGVLTGHREKAFDTSHDGFMSVGAHRLTGQPATLALGQRLFTFPGGTESGRG